MWLREGREREREDDRYILYICILDLVAMQRTAACCSRLLSYMPYLTSARKGDEACRLYSFACEICLQLSLSGSLAQLMFSRAPTDAQERERERGTRDRRYCCCCLKPKLREWVKEREREKEWPQGLLNNVFAFADVFGCFNGFSAAPAR